ncbi:MAG: Maf family protein [Pseudomonadota bacterium]
MNKENQRLIVLASASPRRTALLAQLGVRHRQHPADIDESRRDSELPEDYVRRMADEKAATALAKCNDCVVIGSDTVVVSDGEVLGKPIDQHDHARMFAQLSGRTHHVLTAVTVMDATRCARALSQSAVTFALIGPRDVARYWATGEPADKAGGYAIQGMAALFVERLSGSYSGVMGLPVRETAQLLAQFDAFDWLSEESV